MLKKNWFLIGIGTVLLIGYFFPGFGMALNPRNMTRDVVIVLVFLVTGLTLPSEAILAGLKEFRVHLFVEIFIFAFVPVYFLVTVSLLGNIIPAVAKPGLFALAVLPTTITSCVVFTQVSGGNTVVSMFNAAFSNVAGVIVAPILLSIMLTGTEVSLPPGQLVSVLTSLGLRMLLPIVVGQIARQFLRDWITKRRKAFGIYSNASILIILLFTFSKAAGNPQFSEHLVAMLPVFGYLALSHLLLVTFALLGSRLFAFSRLNRAAVMYAAPQKTLALGAPLLAIYFASQPELLATAILPLLFYHPFQLLTAGILRSIPALNGPGLDKTATGSKKTQ